MKHGIFATLGLALWGGGLAVDYDVRLLTPPDVHKVAPAVYDLTLTTQLLKTQTQATVPEVLSYITLSGPTKFGQLSEDSLLESGYQVDLNGNGRIDEVRIEEGDGLRLDMQPVEPVGDAPYRADGSPKRYRFGPDSPEFMVLSRASDSMTLALEHRASRPEVVDLPNPCLVVRLYEECVGPGGPADLLSPPSFRGEFPGDPACRQNASFFWQIPPRVMGKQQPEWLRSSVYYFGVNNQLGQQTHRLRLNCGQDSQRIGIYAQVIYAGEGGKQIRTSGASGLLLLGSAI